MKKELKFKDANDNTCFVTIELENGRLSISGSVGGCGGQCQDSIAPANEAQRELIDIWNKWHLNDVNAGTMRQAEELKKAGFVGRNYDYSAACQYLKSIDKEGNPLGYIASIIESVTSEATDKLQLAHAALNELEEVRKKARIGKNAWYKYQSKFIRDILKREKEFLSLADLPEIKKAIKEVEAEIDNYIKIRDEYNEKWLFVDNGHKYGHSWKMWELPADIEERINSIVSTIGEYKEPVFTGEHTFNFPNVDVKAKVLHNTSKVSPWGSYGKHHLIELSSDSGKCTFDFWASQSHPTIDSINDLASAVYCFLSDGASYANARDIDDFASELGYAKISEALRAFEACKEAENKARKTLGIADIWEAIDYLQSEYDI